jgi:PAS domain S-box-containing protein
MKELRRIIIILAVMSFVFAALGGYLYYTNLRDSALREAKRQCVTTADTVEKNLSTFLTKYIKPVRALSGMAELQTALADRSDAALSAANAVLDHFRRSFGVEVCYLMDRSGFTIASTNRGESRSFVGRNFAFRPYFQQALRGEPTVYLAKGIVSRKRGAYSSHPVYVPGRDKPLGVVVMKASIEYVESKFFSPYAGTFLVHGPHGIIFITNRDAWLFESTHPLSQETVSEVRSSMQFGRGPWQWVGLRLGEHRATHREGREYFVYRRKIAHLPGWELVYLRSEKAIMQALYGPLFRVLGPTVLVLSLLIGILVFYLYRRAQRELAQRKAAEDHLRESERKYRSIYHNTPAMLHSIDADYKLVSVSDYWLEATGYSREEVIGRRLTDFFTPRSQEYAENEVLPSFFQTGVSKDIPYQFRTKNGDVRDILLSCYGIPDEQGRISRTLAISVDVTERLKVEKELQRAKSKLSRYSRDLERIVRQRTREISGILKNTPAVVYLKNESGQYRLVNPRFEDLFQVSNELAFGKTDEEILPETVAAQYKVNDEQVLSVGEACQFTEWIDLEDGRHTYLSVKFPIYDDEGRIGGVGGISTDITELQKAQDKLKHLSRNILTNQEKERSMISRELHDELGQILTALRMDCVWLEKRLLELDAKASERTAIMRGHIDSTIDRVRHMAFQLRPGALDDLGLVEALESLLSDFERRTEMAFSFEAQEVPELDNAQATAVYRIVQEALTNAVRHSGAKNIDVRVFSHNGSLEIEVEDNGRGFHAEPASSFGLGISGMFERADLVGGRLILRSEPGSGTKLSCSIPVEEQGYQARA